MASTRALDFLTEGARGAGFRLQTAGLPQALATEIGPGYLPIVTPHIRPHGARNPLSGDPFRSAGPPVAETLLFT